MHSDLSSGFHLVWQKERKGKFVMANLMRAMMSDDVHHDSSPEIVALMIGHDQRERIIQRSDQLLYTLQIQSAHRLCSFSLIHNSSTMPKGPNQFQRDDDFVNKLKEQR